MLCKIRICNVNQNILRKSIMRNYVFFCSIVEYQMHDAYKQKLWHYNSRIPELSKQAYCWHELTDLVEKDGTSVRSFCTWFRYPSSVREEVSDWTSRHWTPQNMKFACDGNKNSSVTELAREHKEEKKDQLIIKGTKLIFNS